MARLVAFFGSALAARPAVQSPTMLPRSIGLVLFATVVATTVSVRLAPAQSAAEDTREVIATVQRFFAAMASCDAATARTISLPEGRLYRLGPGSADGPRSSTFEEFATQLATCNRTLFERMWDPQVRVHKGIASLWAPYDFWVNGAFSHCGIDSFELVKTAEGWKLSGGIYTVEREGCTPSPLGPPSISARTPR